MLVMRGQIRIGQAAKELGVSPQYLRILEWEGRIPLARRDYNGRVYSEFDLVLLRSMGVGQRPRRLKLVDEVLETIR
jgi:DNA-binding transcriptional MerR regulator